MERQGNPIGSVKDTKRYVYDVQSKQQLSYNPFLQDILEKVPDEVYKLGGRSTTKHNIIKQYLKEEAMAQQYVKAGKGKPYDGQYAVAKDFYDFSNVPWDKIYSAMMKKK